ncbi:hypothetical protein [Peloplasma aerotolerans]|uniref:Apea-like HEPN domain-containing protein n=1 Tax=Peloplasma aerotolerans TaxID=3044389 RepID=A0AAW6U6F6_9MOLU|nr:hypothetical protein [Mariniplasma sp. M4Ah]MDI6452360.1 hypothetical protein [Mariniplasma sp. M4Ah]
MIRIGNMNINISDFRIAILFFLKKKSHITYSSDIEIENLTWSVKTFKDNYAICATTNGSKKSKKAYYESGYKAIQRFLDVVCLIKKPAMSIDYDTKEQVSFYMINTPEHRSLEIYSRDYLKFDANIEFEIRDLDGNLIESKIEATYYPAVRYLRMSQLSDSLLDAYRYLFLSVESAINVYSPHTKNKENEWFGDVLEHANIKSKNPLVYSEGIKKHFIKNHYTKIRNKLFHSKGKMILPFDNYDMSMLYDAYIDLFDICAMIFEVHFNQNIRGGFSISESVIKSSIEGIKLDEINFSEKNVKSNMEVLKLKNIEQPLAEGYSGKLKIKLKVIDQDKNLAFDKYELNYKGNPQIYYEFKELVVINGLNSILINHSVFFTNRNIIDRPFLW